MSKEEHTEVIERGYAKNMKEWWILVDHHWNDLYEIVKRYAGKFSADAERAKLKRDSKKLLSILNEAWFATPDIQTIHSIPGWGVLCNLCSDFPYSEEEVRKVAGGK